MSSTETLVLSVHFQVLLFDQYVVLSVTAADPIPKLRVSSNVCSRETSSEVRCDTQQKIGIVSDRIVIFNL